MLRKDIEKDPLFREVEKLVAPMGFCVVDVSRSDTSSSIQLHVVVSSPDHDITTDDLAAVYNVVYPRYSVLWNTRDLVLEVSSPGLQRTFKDAYEFRVFTGKLVKLYSSALSATLEGVIESSDEASVTLTDVTVLDRNEKHEWLTIPFAEIQKAKLTYRWEEKKNGK